MPARDRTLEFSSAVKMLQGQNGHAPVALPNESGATGAAALQQRSQFIAAARAIGRDLGATCTKLQKLALLVRKQSLFEDRGGELEELQYIVKQDLAGLAKQLGQLRGASRAHGQRATLNANVMASLSGQLQHVSRDFKVVLESRTSALKQNAARREQFSVGAGAADGASHRALFGVGGVEAGVTSPPVQPSLLLRDEAGNDEAAADNSRYQQQLHLIDEQDAYLQSRADSMRSIEQTVVELGGIFQTLSVMVKEQEEIVLRIDSNTEDAAMNVEAAHSELVSYLKNISSNRWLMFKVFGVVLTFFVIFVLFAA